MSVSSVNLGTAATLQMLRLASLKTLQSGLGFGVDIILYFNNGSWHDRYLYI
jgi:hypothetical protein